MYIPNKHKKNLSSVNAMLWIFWQSILQQYALYNLVDGMHVVKAGGGTWFPLKFYLSWDCIEAKCTLSLVI